MVVEQEAKRVETSSAQPPHLGSRRLRRGAVVVIDDDPLARAVLADAMRARGFDVVEVASARQALAAMVAAEESPLLVLSDLVMPDMDGRTFLALMRSSRRAIPVVIVTASTHGAERELEREGAEAVLDKNWGPCTIAEIADALLLMRGRQAA
jgi:CheY-like chemotaxis protein